MVNRIILVCLTLLALGANAADRTAASCSRDHVNTAMGLAQSGDRVIIPAGTCNWTTRVSWTAPSNVQVLGNGGTATNTQGGSGQTIIQDNVTGTSPILSINTSSSGYFRISNITFRGGTGDNKDSGGMITFGGDSTQFLFDHMYVNKSTYSPQNRGKLMSIGGMLRGVISRSKFHCGTEICWIHFVNGDIGTQDDHGDVPWAQDTGFGTSDFMYVEDSHIDSTRVGDAAIEGTLTDCHTGGKFVIRFTTAFNTNVGQTHPTGHASDDRGCRAHEIYQVTVTSDWTSSNNPNFAFAYSNAGPSLVWGNSVGGTFKHIMYFNECKSSSNCGYTAPYGGWGSCDGSGGWHENTSGQSGWRCVDQVGVGKGDLLNGTFGGSPTKTNQALGGTAWPRQASEPVYEWNTTGDIVPGWSGSWLNNNDSTRIQQNRDFYFHHGNTSCAAGAGSCTAGVGVGTAAQRPSNCTTGVAFWVTNEGNWNGRPGASQGRLYKCTATNTWTLYYTPYTYPHPLAVRFGPVAPTVN